jgi:prophage DNA circulation protein
MLQYKNKLQEASFRGVKFGVKDVNTTIGRRTLLHEYPMRDDPYAEDLGRKAKEFQINAFVMNPNDYTQSKALESALSDYSSAGTLVHPTLGQFQVMVKECTHVTNMQEGGIEYFQVTFVETLGNNFPNISIDTQSLIRNRVNSFIDTSNAYFASNFKTAGYPDFIANSAINNLNVFTNKFRGLVNFGSARNGDPSSYSRLIAQLNSFENSIPQLISDPKTLASQINQLNSDLNASFSDNIALAMLIQGRLYEYGDDFLIIVPTTNLREIELLNQNQLIYLIKASSIAMMVKNVSLTSFASADDAISTRDSIDNRAWPLLQTLADNFADNIYNSLEDVITAMVSDIRVRSTNAATTRTYKIADSLPALVLAYEFLSDATKDSDLIARNNVINPLFVPANSDVKVVGS